MDQLQEIADIPKEFFRDGTQFINRFAVHSHLNSPNAQLIDTAGAPSVRLMLDERSEVTSELIKRLASRKEFVRISSAVGMGFVVMGGQSHSRRARRAAGPDKRSDRLRRQVDTHTCEQHLGWGRIGFHGRGLWVRRRFRTVSPGQATTCTGNYTSIFSEPSVETLFENCPTNAIANFRINFHHSDFQWTSSSFPNSFAIGSSATARERL